MLNIFIFFSSYLTIISALDFRKQIGGEKRIQEYCHNLAVQGGKPIASILNTQVMGPEYLIANMVNIKLPIFINNREFTEAKFTEILFEKYHSVFKHADQWHPRRYITI